ncbi:hypothetical protein HDV02_006627 [Globomyces sp. JEL0801]|nr:hypothetical protein HDV02_006627 [Globomyces sp. JEL0801]
MDRVGNKYYHYGQNTRIYKMDTKSRWSVLTDSLEECRQFVKTISSWSIGCEAALCIYVRSKVVEVMEELERREAEEKRLREEEQERLRILAEEKEKKLAKRRLEVEALLINGPRRSARVKRDYQEYKEDTDSELEFTDEDSDETAADSDEETDTNSNDGENNIVIAKIPLRKSIRLGAQMQELN